MLAELTGHNICIPTNVSHLGGSLRPGWSCSPSGRDSRRMFSIKGIVLRGGSQPSFSVWLCWGFRVDRVSSGEEMSGEERWTD